MAQLCIGFTLADTEPWAIANASAILLPRIRMRVSAWRFDAQPPFLNPVFATAGQLGSVVTHLGAAGYKNNEPDRCVPRGLDRNCHPVAKCKAGSPVNYPSSCGEPITMWQKVSVQRSFRCTRFRFPVVAPFHNRRQGHQNRFSTST